MPNGIRLVDVSASIAQDQLLPIGTDRFGDDQVLLGLLPISGSTLEFILMEAQGWGNREIRIPSFADPTAPGGGDWWVPPLYSRILKNKTVTYSARQTAVGAETERLLAMMMIADESGGFPASITRHMGDLHTQFAEGTATSGSFGGVTATQDILNEVANDMWLPLMAASVGDTPGQVQYRHPRDEGFPAIGITSATTDLGNRMFTALPPTNPMAGADTLTYRAQDDSGAAVQMFLYTARVANGVKVLSNRTPFSL